MRVTVRRDVIFNEADFGCPASTESESHLNTIEVDSHVGTEDVEQVDEQKPQENRRRSERRRKPPIRYRIDECVDLATTLENSVQHVAYSIWQITEPKSMEEAVKNDHAKEWKIAADQEYHSLMENDTWELTKLPEGHKPIGSKWVFKVKYRRVERFKGRLVAKGFTQTYGIDYDETFSPVVRFSSIRALLAFAVQNNMLIHQMDVVTVFLSGKLDEEIYMHQPDGYVVQGKQHLVC